MGKRTKKQLEKLKELYIRYNQCRDAELDRFWKNSVFVWVFLALCFAAFGTLVKDYNMPTKAMCEASIISKNDYYMFLAIISVCGLILSFIWVWMARGLKAWYEVYEMAIWRMETYKNEFKYPREYLINNFWTVKESSCCLKKWFMDSKPFSPSKIVILIGWLLVIIWAIAFGYSFGHYFSYELSYCCSCRCCCCSHICSWLFGVGGIIIGLVFICLIKFLVFSSTLRSKEKKKVFDKIWKDIETQVYTLKENMTDEERNEFYDFYLEVKDKDVKFIFFDKKLLEKGLQLIPKYYNIDKYNVNETEMAIMFDLNLIAKNILSCDKT